MLNRCKSLANLIPQNVAFRGSRIEIHGHRYAGRYARPLHARLGRYALRRATEARLPVCAHPGGEQIETLRRRGNRKGMNTRGWVCKRSTFIRGGRLYCFQSEVNREGRGRGRVCVCVCVYVCG